MQQVRCTGRAVHKDPLLAANLKFELRRATRPGFHGPDHQSGTVADPIDAGSRSARKAATFAAASPPCGHRGGRRRWRRGGRWLFPVGGPWASNECRRVLLDLAGPDRLATPFKPNWGSQMGLKCVGKRMHYGLYLPSPDQTRDNPVHSRPRQTEPAP